MISEQREERLEFAFLFQRVRGTESMGVAHRETHLSTVCQQAPLIKQSSQLGLSSDPNK
jgi:hypothetical protein